MADTKTLNLTPVEGSKPRPKPAPLAKPLWIPSPAQRAASKVRKTQRDRIQANKDQARAIEDARVKDFKSEEALAAIASGHAKELYLQFSKILRLLPGDIEDKALAAFAAIWDGENFANLSNEDYREMYLIAKNAVAETFNDLTPQQQRLLDQHGPFYLTEGSNVTAIADFKTLLEVLTDRVKAAKNLTCTQKPKHPRVAMCQSHPKPPKRFRPISGLRR